YQKLGFEINKQSNNYYENGAAAYKMTIIIKI
ncbi:ribosomal-protein-alanine acetyltransferase, partial [Francisella tularensis subsp. holarctica]|nr:ribosomal-protein-alanine acetyltransferase [Francisella tularensis subsp. holarctica]